LNSFYPTWLKLKIIQIPHFGKQNFSKAKINIQLSDTLSNNNDCFPKSRRIGPRRALFFNEKFWGKMNSVSDKWVTQAGMKKLIPNNVLNHKCRE